MGLRETLMRAPAWVRWLLALLPLRIALIPVIPLLPEEAYHWNFARHLDWGYLDHPPVIAWAIAAGRLVFGDTSFGVRAVPLLFSVGTSILLARLTRRFYGDVAAVWAVILFTFEPVALPVSEAGFPDSPLLFFWALSMTLVWDAIEGQDGRRWLAAGAALGAAMLSKYTAVFLVPSVFVYLVLSKRDRRWLATPWPYLAGVAALLVFSPVIYWNWKHEWASFLYQSGGRFKEAQGTPGRPGRFLLNQALAVFPLTLPLAGVALARLFRTARPEEQFFRACLLPIFLVFWIISWIRPAHPLWPLPGYLSLVVVMSGVAAEAAGTIGRLYARSRNGFVALCLVGLIGGGIHLVYFLPFVSPLQGPYGWKELAERAIVVRRELPESAFYLAFGRKYTCTSQLAYKLNRPDDVHGANLIGEPALQYGYWCDPRSLQGRDALIVVEGEIRATVFLATLKGCFDSLEPAGEVVVPVGRSPLIPHAPLTFLLYKGRGYHPPATTTTK
jgi:dolichol-phosphate mannosyltransferase